MREISFVLCPYFQVTPMQAGALGLDDTAGVRVHPEPGMVGITAVASVKGYSSPLPDPNLIGQRRDIALGIHPTIPDVINGVPSSLRNNSPLKKGESNLLFVDGLPTDCTRREVSRILLHVSLTCMCVLSVCLFLCIFVPVFDISRLLVFYQIPWQDIWIMSGVLSSSMTGHLDTFQIMIALHII